MILDAQTAKRKEVTMKSRHCPVRGRCLSKGLCEKCEFGKAFEGLHGKTKRLKDKNKALEEENNGLKSRIEALTDPDF